MNETEIIGKIRREVDAQVALAKTNIERDLALSAASIPIDDLGIVDNHPHPPHGWQLPGDHILAVEEDDSTSNDDVTTIEFRDTNTVDFTVSLDDASPADPHKVIVTATASGEGGDHDHRWEFGTPAVDETGPYLPVGIGVWERNGMRCQWATEETPGKVRIPAAEDKNGEYFVYAELGGGTWNGQQYLVALFPSEVTVKMCKKADYGDPTDVDPDAVTPYIGPNSNIKCVLGEATVAGNIITVATQWYFSDKDDGQEIPDGNSASSATPDRNTIERNDDYDSAHHQELQLVNVDTVEYAKRRHPTFEPDANGSGSLAWSGNDHDLQLAQKSLENREVDGKLVQQLFNFDTGDDITLDTGDKVLVRDADGPVLAYKALTQITFITEVYWDVSDHKLKYKDRTAWVIDPSAVSAYKDIVEFVECDDS